MPKIKLKVTHTHAGVAYPAGHVIDADGHTARWLIDHRIGEIDMTSKRAQTASESVAPAVMAKQLKPIEE